MTDKYQVTIGGFETKRQAKAFLSWYEGGGEQSFDDYLDCQDDMSSDEGCYINVQRIGNSGRYYDETDEGFYAEVR